MNMDFELISILWTKVLIYLRWTSRVQIWWFRTFSVNFPFISFLSFWRYYGSDWREQFWSGDLCVMITKKPGAEVRVCLVENLIIIAKLIQVDAIGNHVVTHCMFRSVASSRPITGIMLGKWRVEGRLNNWTLIGVWFSVTEYRYVSSLDIIELEVGRVILMHVNEFSWCRLCVTTALELFIRRSKFQFKKKLESRTWN